jgi:hypothetical protein
MKNPMITAEKLPIKDAFVSPPPKGSLFSGIYFPIVPSIGINPTTSATIDMIAASLKFDLMSKMQLDGTCFVH